MECVQERPCPHPQATEHHMKLSSTPYSGTYAEKNFKGVSSGLNNQSRRSGGSAYRVLNSRETNSVT